MAWAGVLRRLWALLTEGGEPQCGIERRLAGLI